MTTTISPRLTQEELEELDCWYKECGFESQADMVRHVDTLTRIAKEFASRTDKMSLESALGVVIRAVAEGEYRYMDSPIETSDPGDDEIEAWRIRMGVPVKAAWSRFLAGLGLIVLRSVVHGNVDLETFNQGLMTCARVVFQSELGQDVEEAAKEIRQCNRVPKVGPRTYKVLQKPR